MDVNRQMQYLQTKEMNFEDVVGIDKEITRLRNEQEKYLELRAGLYEDLKRESSHRQTLRILAKSMKSSI